MLAGVSSRRFERTREPVGEDVLAAERSASKSAVSREFVGRTGEHLQALMSRSLADLRLAALMLGGIDLKGRCYVVALGVSTEGVKVPLGLWDGSTENKTITVALLSDLVERGLDVGQGVLVVLDHAAGTHTTSGPGASATINAALTTCSRVQGPAHALASPVGSSAPATQPLSASHRSGTTAQTSADGRRGASRATATMRGRRSAAASPRSPRRTPTPRQRCTAPTRHVPLQAPPRRPRRHRRRCDKPRRGRPSRAGDPGVPPGPPGGGLCSDRAAP